MRAGSVAARDERRLRGGNLAQCLEHVVAAGDPRGIALRADHDEVVVHHVEALHAETLGEEILFRRLIVHEDHVGIAAPTDVERLAGSDGNDIHADPGFGGELREEIAEEARLLGGSR